MKSPIFLQIIGDFFLKVEKMIKNLLKIFVFVLSIMGCAKKTESKIPSTVIPIVTKIIIPEQTVNKTELDYDRKKSIWTLDGRLYSGYAVSFQMDNKTLKEKIGIFDGKKQNQVIQWYPDGHYKSVSNYHKGKLHGEKKSWTSDSTHILVSHLKYVSGKVDGEQKKWYSTGELFQKLNFKMGKQEGIQQAFRKNGALFANYEAKEGRVFGLKKAALCFGVENDKIRYKNE